MDVVDILQQIYSIKDRFMRCFNREDTLGSGRRKRRGMGYCVNNSDRSDLRGVGQRDFCRNEQRINSIEDVDFLKQKKELIERRIEELEKST